MSSNRLLRMLLGGVVHQDVEPAELFDRLLDGAPAKCLAADVAADQEALGAVLFDAALGFLGVLGFFEIDDRHVGAFAGEVQRHRAADAAVAAGDERGLAREPAAAGHVGQDRHGLGVHGALAAGPLATAFAAAAPPFAALAADFGFVRHGGSLPSRRYVGYTLVADATQVDDCISRAAQNARPIEAGMAFATDGTREPAHARP